MPRGDKNAGQKIGKSTRFSGETAADAARKRAAKQRETKPLRDCLRGIATQALYGKPPLSDAQLQPVAEFFGVKIPEVTFAHLAIYKQSIEMAKGDQAALNLVAAYAGEKPVENIAITTPDAETIERVEYALFGGEGG